MAPPFLNLYSRQRRVVSFNDAALYLRKNPFGVGLDALPSGIRITYLRTRSLVTVPTTILRFPRNDGYREESSASTFMVTLWFRRVLQ
jgi:hypothetical protein